MGNKWTFAFSKVLFLTQITRFEKNALTSSSKKNFWSFSCFLSNFIGIWFHVYNFGFWPNSSHLYRIKMGWSGENFHKANIFMNPPDAGYDPFAFSVSNWLILVKTLLYFQYKLTNFGKILVLFSYKSIDIDRNT